MLLEVRHLTVEYGRREGRVRALDDASFSMAAGEAVGVVGESGSGKSTLALAILRLIRPEEGRILSGAIRYEGRELLDLPEPEMRALRGRRIAMVFQDPFSALDPVLRIRSQMTEFYDAHGLSCRDADLEEALARVQLEPGRVLSSYPHQLSGGQRQRVMIAMALLGRPTLLLADEPTTALDVLVQKDILDLLMSLQKTLGISLLLISHNIALVAGYTQRLIVMREGRIVEDRAARDLIRQPHERYTQELLQAVPRMPPLPPGL